MQDSGEEETRFYAGEALFQTQIALMTAEEKKIIIASVGRGPQTHHTHVSISRAQVASTFERC